jgi:hypothetical protein
MNRLQLLIVTLLSVAILPPVLAQDAPRSLYLRNKTPFDAQFQVAGKRCDAPGGRKPGSKCDFVPSCSSNLTPDERCVVVNLPAGTVSVVVSIRGQQLTRQAELPYLPASSGYNSLGFGYIPPSPAMYYATCNLYDDNGTFPLRC